MRGRWSVFGIVAFVVLVSTRAQAGNDDSFFQGNDAAMLGGAVAAVGEGPDLLWYNPAGLGENQRGRLELSGSVFSLRIRHLDPFLVVDYGDGTTSTRGLRSTEFQSVPSAISYVRRLSPRVTAGFGVFVPVQDAFAAARTVLEDGDGFLELATNQSFQHQRLHLGPGFGVDLGRLRLGASLFFVYERIASNERPSLQIELMDGVRVAASEDLRFELSRLALELVIGAQLELPRGVHLAAVVRGPRIRLQDRVQIESLSFGAFTDGTETDFFFGRERGQERLRDRKAVLAAPIEVLTAIGWKSEDVRLSAEVRFTHAYEGLFENVFQYNFRAGVAFHVGEHTELGFGFFTDRTPQIEAYAALALLDYYGGSVGMTFDTPVSLGRDDDDDGPRELVFRTTVAFRYAAGIGAGFGTQANLGTEDGLLFDYTPPIDVLFHEVGLYLGSGLDF
ncbi:MAG: hypothetical protein KC586_22905 [Myxococcales bacterium]|nr:hypothetical protein [Myxococcales bacterium]